MERFINGIQQVGIGVNDAAIAFEWYKKYFGFNTVVFEDVAKASLMHRYTGGQVYERYAVLAMNMQGGGGIEIWQYTNRRAVASYAPLQLGDRGIFAVKIKCRNVEALYDLYRKNGLDIISTVSTDPAGKKFFFIRDPFGNVFQMIEDEYWFQHKKGLTGGVCGAIIGVSHLDKSVQFYQNILDYKTTLYEGTNLFDDLKRLSGGNRICKRTMLINQPLFCGAFSKLLGPSTIELIEVEGETKKIFEGRYWGDLGFIHVCYDVCSMKTHESICKENGHPLTVNSGDSFDMGQAAGQFAYNEDPDETLIEYVETHKVPIFKKLGWYLHLRKRKNKKAFPNWIVKCLELSKKTLQLSVASFKSIE